jgi:hypothetical protein
LRWDLPDSSLPRFIWCIVRPTLLDALAPYFRGIRLYLSSSEIIRVLQCDPSDDLHCPQAPKLPAARNYALGTY